jgi:hypothetical protein
MEGCLVNDVTALMGKLRAKVGYRRFEESGSQDKTQWPVLRRVADARRQAAEPEGAAPPTIATPAIETHTAEAARGGSALFRRYREPTPPPQEGGRGALSDIFAKLERKTR